MSANGDDEIPGREIAYRVFAAEYDDASLSYAESDEERAPNYVITPTGARLNRLFAVGTLTEVTSVNDEMVRARIVDPTGAFVVYAGQYQPDELAFLEKIDPPEFVAVTGKARTFQPDDSDQVYTSIRPESIATVDADTRDRWVVSAAERTVDRVGAYAAAAELEAGGESLTERLREAGVESGLASGIPLAQDHYGTTAAYLAALRDCSLEAVEVIAGELDQVSGLSVDPDGTSPVYESATFGSLADLADVDLEGVAVDDARTAEPAAATAGVSEGDAGEQAVSSGSATGTATASEPATESELEFDSEAESSGAETDGAELETEAGDAEEVDGGSASQPAETDGDGEAVDAGADGAETAESDAEEELGEFDAGDGGGMYEMDDEEREQLEEEFGAEFTTGSEVDEPGAADIDVPEPDAEPVDGEDAADDESEEDDLGAPPESGLEAESAETDADAAEPDLEGDSDEAAEESTEHDESETETETDDLDEAAEDTGDEATVDDTDAGDEAVDDTDDPEEVTDETGDDEDAVDDAADEPADDVDLQEYVVETMQELDDGDGADRAELVETVAADTGASEGDVEDAIQDALMGGQCYEPGDGTLKAI